MSAKDPGLSPWPLEECHLWAGIHASLSGDHWPPAVVWLNYSQCNRQHKRLWPLFQHQQTLVLFCPSSVRRGVFTLDQCWNLFLGWHFKIFLLVRWRTYNVWFNAARPINTTLTLSKQSCCELSKMTGGLKIFSKQELEEFLISDFNHVAGWMLV